MTSLSPYKKVVAVIVTYNGSKWVHQCLSSFRESDYPISVIVVDNNSSDDTVAMIEESYPEVKLIRQQTNLGFGGANNIGIKEALRENADYIFLLNQDAWVEKNTIHKLVKAFEENKSYGVISPMHYSGTGAKLDYGFEICISKNYSKESILNFETEPTDQVNSCEFINAAAWLVSRECLQKIGGFGPVFFHYGEDRDYINRLNYNKLKIGFITNCKIFHDREGREINSYFTTMKKMSWYYSLACVVWFSNINKSLVTALVAALYNLNRDILYHFLKGRLYAWPALFVALFNFILSLGETISYRRLLTSKAEYLFLREPEI